jgi:Protein of unknown function (DUF2723)
MGCVPRPPATGSPDPSRGGTPEKRLELPPVDLLNRKKERVSEQKDPWRTSPWALLNGAFACVLGVGLSAAVLVLYVKTLAPTVLYYDPKGIYDSVMLQVHAYILDIPHPTGYPTYVLLTHLFTYLPFGDVAYRVNLASAVYAAVAVLLIFALCARLTGRLGAAAGAALLFGVSRAFWSQAVIAEVYTLNVLFVALVILVLLLWQRRRTDRWLMLAAFLIGLSMSHHMTSGLLIPAALLFVGLVERRKLTERRLALKGAGLFLLGLTPYLYLPIRASMNPPINETDPSSLGNFLIVVTGSRFDNRMFAFGITELPGRLAVYVAHLQEQFHPAFLLVGALGAAYLLFRNRAALAMLFFLYLGWLLYALGYNIADVYLYYIPTYLILCIFVAAGFAAVIEAASLSAQGLRPLPRATLLAALSVPLMLAPVPGVGETYDAVDRSWDRRGRDMIEALAEGAERDSTVLHNSSFAWYMTLVDHRRTDLRVIDPFPAGEWTARNARWLTTAQRYLDDGRVYIVFPGTTVTKNEPIFEEAGYELVADESGFFYEVVRRQHPPAR